MRGARTVTMTLPHGREWLWYDDLGILALAPHLDAAGRERAVDEMQEQWRLALNDPLGTAA